MKVNAPKEPKEYNCLLRLQKHIVSLKELLKPTITWQLTYTKFRLVFSSFILSSFGSFNK